MPKYLYVRYLVSGRAEFRFLYDEEGVAIMRGLNIIGRSWDSNRKIWVVFSEPFITEAINKFEAAGWVIQISREADENEEQRRRERERWERQERTREYQERRARENQQRQQSYSRSEGTSGNRAQGSTINGAHYDKVFTDLFRLVAYDRRDALYKALVRVFHPDVGGDEEMMKSLNKVAGR